MEEVAFMKELKGKGRIVYSLFFYLTVTVVPLVVIFTKCDGRLAIISSELQRDSETGQYSRREIIKQRKKNAERQMNIYLEKCEAEVGECCGNQKVIFLATGGRSF